MNKSYFEKVASIQVVSVKKKELTSAFREVQADWKKYLKQTGVKLPLERTAKWYQLATLKHFQGKAVHKDDIAALIKRLMRKSSATDQQIRHLKTQGSWFVLNRGDSVPIGNVETFNPEGYHVLIATDRPLPNSTVARRAVVSAGSWQEILRQYDFRCASCGTKIGEYHRFDKTFKVEVLEKGHMNPLQPLKPGNIIPQCRWCNKTARGDFVFDEQGRPSAIASVRPVKRAEDKVIKQVEKWIQGRASGKKEK